MWVVKVFDSSEKLQTYLRTGGGTAEGDYFKTLQAGGQYYLILYV